MEINSVVYYRIVYYYLLVKCDLYREHSASMQTFFVIKGRNCEKMQVTSVENQVAWQTKGWSSSIK